MKSYCDNWLKTTFVSTSAIIFALLLLFILPIAFEKPLIAIAVPLMALFGFLLVVKPEFCFLVIFISRSSIDTLLEQTKMSLGGQSLGAGAILNLVMIFLALLFWLKKAENIKHVPLKKNWAVFLIIMALTVTYSPDKGNGIKLVENFLSYYAIFLMPFFLIQDERQAKFWFKVFALSFVVPVLRTNMDFFSHEAEFIDVGSRFHGPFTHPNILAFYLVLGVAVVMYSFKRTGFQLSPVQKSLLILLLVNMFVELLATKTRNAWVAMWAMFFIYGVIQERKFMLITLVAIPLALCIPAIHERVFDIVHQSNRSLAQGMNSWEWRLVAWKSSLEWIMKSPFFGYGLASFVPLSVNFFHTDVGIGAHNAYLQVLFECGVVGLFAFLALLLGAVGAVYKIWKIYKRPEYAVMFVYMISYLVICFADNLLYYLVLNWSFWFFTGFVLRESQLKKETAQP